MNIETRKILRWVYVIAFATVTGLILLILVTWFTAKPIIVYYQEGENGGGVSNLWMASKYNQIHGD